MKFLKKFKAYLRLLEAVKKADNEFKKNGERYYVMPGYDRKLIIMDRRNFRLLKKKHYITNKATVKNLELECFYCTPYKDGKGQLTKEDIKSKREEYYKWLRL